MKTTAYLGTLVIWAGLLPAQSQTNYWIPTGNALANYDVRSFAENSQGTLFAGTWTDGSVWRTNDLGYSWTRCAQIPYPNPVLALAVRPSGHLFACVYLQGIFRSTDNGSSWQEKDSGLTANTLHGAVVDNFGNVWVTTESGLFRSTDDGESWSLRRAGVFYNVFLDSTYAIASDDGVVLHRSTDQGATWTTSPITAIGFTGVHPDGSYFASTLTSDIFRSTDYGVSWTDLHSGVSWSGASWSTTFSVTGSTYYGRNGYQTGVLVSRDTGKTWVLTNSGLTNTSINVLYRAHNGYIYVATGDGVFRSRVSTVLSATPVIQVSPGQVDFGSVRSGSIDSVSVSVSNLGFRDTLRIGSLLSTNPHFTAAEGPLIVPPDSARGLIIYYLSTTAGKDTGTILISSNDPTTPIFSLPVTGTSYGLSHAPQITQISFVPNYARQAHLTWTRTLDDTAGATDPVIQYSVWCLGPTGGSPGAMAYRPRAFASVDAAWDFIGIVPAIGLDEYGYTAALPYAYSAQNPWYVFMVAAQTKSLKVFQSVPDSIQDPVSTTAIGGSSPSAIPRDVVLRQNYPNPFNPSTRIQYGLPRRSAVSLIVYNTLGQRVAVLVEREQDAGFYEVTFDGTSHASGIYYCRLRTDDVVRTQKLLLIR